jgi:hypothetical protein
MTVGVGLGLFDRLRRLWRRGQRVTSGELREQLAQVREQVLDETAELARDGDDLAARIRRNARSSRGVFGGGKPL